MNDKPVGRVFVTFPTWSSGVNFLGLLDDQLKPHGNGNFILDSGEIFDAQFDHGEFVSESTHTHANFTNIRLLAPVDE